MSRILTTAFISLALLHCSCSESTSPVPDEPDGAIDKRAMLMDLYLTDAIKPSMKYYSRICGDFKRMQRMLNEDQMPLLGLGFRFAYDSGTLLMKFDEKTTALVDSLKYTAWDSLNSEYGMHSYRKSTGTYFTLHFECCTHMDYLDDLYRLLPGVEYVNKNWMNLPVSGVYPRADGDTMYYYFETPEYCVDWNLCYGYQYLYVKTYDSEVELLGYWDKRIDEKRPAWYREALGIYNDWWYYFYE